MNHLDPWMFQRMFRVVRLTFDEVVGKIAPFMKDRCEKKAQNSSGSVISIQTRLAVTLRWLVGASYLDLCFSWKISTSSFFSRRGVLIYPIISTLQYFYMWAKFPCKVILTDLHSMY